MERLDAHTRAFDEDVPTPNRSDTACPECGGTMITSDLETVCVDCGLVIKEDRLDHGRSGGRSRTASRHDRGLSTAIGRGEDAYG